MSTASAAQGQRPPPPPDGASGGGKSGPPDHAAAIETLGGSLTEDVKTDLLANVAEMQDSGESFEDIKAFVDSELEANGVDVSSEGRRTGQLIDIMS